MTYIKSYLKALILNTNKAYENEYENTNIIAPEGHIGKIFQINMTHITVEYWW
jgi:hypothetical protein